MILCAGNYFIGNIIQMLGEGYALVEKSGIQKDVLMNIIKLMFYAPSFISYGQLTSLCCGSPYLLDCMLAQHAWPIPSNDSFTAETASHV